MLVIGIHIRGYRLYVYAVRACEHAFEVVPVVGLCLPAAKFLFAVGPTRSLSSVRIRVMVNVWVMFRVSKLLVSAKGHGYN